MSRFLLDTNVVIRLAEKTAPEHPVVERAVLALLARSEVLLLAPQVLVEFWVVATRPAERNGFGWSPPSTAAALTGLRQQFAMPDEGPAIFDRWLALVQAQAVLGKRVHDARIAAFMLVHGIPSILTLNPADFVGLPGITAVHPDDVPT